MRSLGWAGLLVGLLVIFLGCSLADQGEEASTAVEGGAAHPGEASAEAFIGTIREIYPANEARRQKGILGSVLIEREIGKEHYADKVSTKITDETRIFAQEGGGARQAVTFDRLAIGQEVQVTFTGPFLESYPLKATAREIMILP